jgi:hypothetical protein
MADAHTQWMQAWSAMLLMPDGELKEECRGMLKTASVKILEGKEDGDSAAVREGLEALRHVYRKIREESKDTPAA